MCVYIYIYIYIYLYIICINADLNMLIFPLKHSNGSAMKLFLPGVWSIYTYVCVTNREK